MRKKLLTFLGIILMIGVAHGQSTILTNASDTIRIDTTVTSMSSHIVEIFTLKNNSNTDTLKMNWKVVQNTFPHSATVTLCDPNNCYSSSVFSSTIRYSFLPQAFGIMKLDFSPQCVSTSAVFKVHTWATNDSANTDATLTWILNVTAQCATSISDIDASQISIYPNPVRNEMRINLPSNLENGQIDIYNLIGSKVYSQSVGKSAKEIDLSSLESGLYVARISENGKIIATRKFTKTDD